MPQEAYGKVQYNFYISSQQGNYRQPLLQE